MLLGLLRLPRRLRVLEVGCGRGTALPVLWRLLRPRRLIGLDVDLALLVEAAANLIAQDVPAEVAHGDVRSLPFPDRSLDLCIDFGTLFHIAESERALSEIARVLEPGGWLVTETRPNQVLSHPVRSRGRRIPWRAAPGLVRDRFLVFWQAHRLAG